MYILGVLQKYFISIFQGLTCNAIEIQKKTIEFVLKYNFMPELEKE